MNVKKMNNVLERIMIEKMFFLILIPFIMLVLLGCSKTMSQEERDTIVKGIEDNMVYIEAGDDSFVMCKYEVTQEEWMAIMGVNPVAERMSVKEYLGDKKPVFDVSVVECDTFIKRLNKLTGLNYRFPTLWEWYFVATEGFTRNDIFGGHTPKEAGWYQDNIEQYRAPQEVGKLKPNKFGIYDLFGNVGEYAFSKDNVIDYVNNNVEYGIFKWWGGSYYTFNIENFKDLEEVWSDGATNGNLGGSFGGLRLVRSLNGEKHIKNVRNG